MLLTAIFEIAGRTLGVNPVRTLLHFSGKTSLNLLIATLLVTPLSVWSGNKMFLSVRRMLGLYAFFYACLHFLIYTGLELDFNFKDLKIEITKRPYIIIGMIALIGLTLLALTSTRKMMRRLGKNWQYLHALIYPISILTVVHYYWQVKIDVREPLLYAGVLSFLLFWRVLRKVYKTN